MTNFPNKGSTPKGSTNARENASCLVWRRIRGDKLLAKVVDHSGDVILQYSYNQAHIEEMTFPHVHRVTQ